MPTPLIRLDADGVPLRAPSALSLDGEDDYLYRSEAVASSFPYSVAFWVRVPSGAVGWIFGQYFLSSYGNYLYLADGTLTAYSDHRPGDVYAASGADASGAISADTWHFVVAVWESASSRKLSIDGGAFATDSTNIDAQSPMTGITLGGLGSHASGVTGQMAADIDNLGIWGRALSDAEVDQLYAGGAGLAYDALDAGLLSGLISFYELGEANGPRADLHGEKHLYPVGGPTATPGHAPDDANARARHGDRVAAIGDAAAEGGGVVFYDFPNRLATDSSGPGMTISGSAPLVGDTFDLFFRAEDFHGTAARLFTCDDGAGTVAAIDVDADGVFSFSIDGPAGSGSVTATQSAFGEATVTGGSATAGTSLVALTLTIADRLDACEGDHITVSGCGAPFDAALAVVLGYHWDESAGTGTLRYQGVDNTGAGSTPTAGTITLHGRYEESADQRTADPVISWCAGFRVTRAAGQLDFYRNEHHLGGAALSASLVGNPATGSLTAGVRDGDSETPVAWLPSRVEVHGSVLSDADATSLLAALCRRPRVVDGYGGEVYRERIECLPGVWRQEMAQAEIAHFVIDDATGQMIEGNSYNGDVDGRAEGVASSVSLGSFLQEGTTTYSYEIHVASRAYDQSGSRVAQNYLHRSTITATRRPWPRQLHVNADAEAGNDSTGDGSSGSPYATINKAISQSLPGTLILAAASGTAYSRFVIGATAPNPLAVAEADGATPWQLTCYDGVVDVGAKLNDSRGATVSGMRVSHGPEEDGNPFVVTVHGAVGWSLLNYRDADAGSSQVPMLVYSNRPTDDGAIHGLHAESGAAYIQYGVFLGSSARGLSVRRARIDRPHQNTTHVSRIYSSTYGEYAAVTHDPPAADGWDTASVSFRAGCCRTTIRDCATPDNKMQVWATQTLLDPPSYHPGGAAVIPTRVLVARNQFFSIAVDGSISSSRFSCNWVQVESPGPAVSSGDPGDFDAEILFPSANSVVIEASTGTLLTDPGTILRAMPTGAEDNRRNLVSSNFATGESLVSGTLASLSGIPDGRAIAVMDGLPLGGTAPISMTATLDGAALDGAPSMLLVAVAEPGSRTLQVNSGDGASATATGTGLSMTVGGASSSPKYLFVRVGGKIYPIGKLAG